MQLGKQMAFYHIYFPSKHAIFGAQSLEPNSATVIAGAIQSNYPRLWQVGNKNTVPYTFTKQNKWVPPSLPYFVFLFYSPLKYVSSVSQKNMFLHFQKEPPREHLGPTCYDMTGLHHFLISTSFLNFLYPLHHLLYFSALLNLITLPFTLNLRKSIVILLFTTFYHSFNVTM